MTAEVIYQGNLRTFATHTRSGNKCMTDAPTDNRGKGETFSPTDMVAVAHASCILTIMGIKAMDHEIDMTGTRIQTTKTMASDPRRIIRLEVEITMPNKEFTAKEKKILEKAAYLCPVKNSLHPDLEEIIHIHWPK
jgi:putative redox protein